MSEEQKTDSISFLSKMAISDDGNIILPEEVLTKCGFDLSTKFKITVDVENNRIILDVIPD